MESVTTTERSRQYVDAAAAKEEARLAWIASGRPNDSPEFDEAEQLYNNARQNFRNRIDGMCNGYVHLLIARLVVAGKLNEADIVKPEGDSTMTSTSCPKCSRVKATATDTLEQVMDGTGPLCFAARFGVGCRAKGEWVGEARDDCTDAALIAIRRFQLTGMRIETDRRE